MKTSTPKFLALLLSLALSTSVVGVAQDFRHAPENQAAHRESKTYFDANVLPVLLLQRQKLETQLAADDRAQLVTYRTQLNDLRTRGQALHEALRPVGGPEGQRPPMSEAQREQLFGLHSQTREVMTNVYRLTQKYNGAIDKLVKEVEPRTEKWANDMQAIAVKNTTPEAQRRMVEFGGGHMGMYLHGPLHHLLRPSKFLLMEATAPASPSERSLSSISFYPNPAAAATQFDYELKNDGPITVELLDQNGNKLRTLVSEAQQSKGAHTQQLDLRDLPAGPYFYRTTTQSGTETKRLVKE